MSMSQLIFGNQNIPSNFGVDEFGNQQPEVVEFMRGTTQTRLYLYFNNRGFLTGFAEEHRTITPEPNQPEYRPTTEEEYKNQLLHLEREKERAIEVEDYTTAAEMRDRIYALKKQHSTT